MSESPLKRQTPMSTPPVSSDHRQAALARQISTMIGQGRRIEAQNPFDAILVRGRGLELRERITIDEWGNLLVEKLPVDRNRLIMLIGVAAVIVAFIIYAVATA